jgi:prepilin-type processing-associated H-X9-DG protein
MMARARSAFTLIELLVCIAIVIVLILILLPVFANHGCGPSCESKLRQLGTAVAMYVQDYDNTYPAGGAAGDHRGPGAWEQQSESVAYSRRSSRWVVQVLPYVKYSYVFACRQDTCLERNETDVLVPGSETPFHVSYGPNRFFVDPSAYGWKKRTIATTQVEQPERKYFLADCATAAGFDLESIAYLRYPNYDPSMQQNGWTPIQFEAAGRVAWSDQAAEPLTRHLLESNILFADGHVERLRHDRIPNNDGPEGPDYRTLTEALVPWQLATKRYAR